MSKKGNDFYINNKKTFSVRARISADDLRASFTFAHSMTFGKTGEHRDHRSGGTHRRKNGELFINTFQGKIAEFAVYRTFIQSGVSCLPPDLETFSLGIWDSSDLVSNNKHINIKSSKYYANLLLLETKDWDTQGRYLPNLSGEGNAEYDFFIFVRVKPDGEKIMKSQRLLYSETVSQSQLWTIISNEIWEYDIPGFIAKEELCRVISGCQIIPRGAMLNGQTRMDAENYYIQCGDMCAIEELALLLQA